MFISFILRVFILMDISPYQVYAFRMFSLFCGLYIYFLIVSFEVQRFLIFIKFYLVLFSYMGHAFVVESKESLPL